MTAGSAGELRIVSMNLLDGGVDPDGTAVRRDQSAALLNAWKPHLVLLQELCAPEDRARRRFRALANATGLEPCAFGQPRGSKGQRCGILADTRTLAVIDDGPPATRDAPFWAEAAVQVRADGTMLNVTSVHAPSTTGTGQLTEAERLATRTAQRGALAVAGGDWNCYTPDDQLTPDDLAGLEAHLLPARTLPSGGRLAGNYRVHDVLTAVGMTDPVPELPPDLRDPPVPPGTGSAPGARIDRFYLWPGHDLLPAVRRYEQKPNPGSDHQAIMIALEIAALATVTTPGFHP